MERRTHAYHGSLAVFLIGLRIHKPWSLGLVRSAVMAMPRMLTELEQNRAAADRGEEESLGYLGSRLTVHLTGVTTIQWWRSTDDIYAYANAGVREHRPAWVEFYRLAKADPDAVTIWHETYPSPRVGWRASTLARGPSVWLRWPAPSRCPVGGRAPGNGSAAQSTLRSLTTLAAHGVGTTPSNGRQLYFGRTGHGARIRAERP